MSLDELITRLDCWESKLQNIEPEYADPKTSISYLKDVVEDLVQSLRKFAKELQG